MAARCWTGSAGEVEPEPAPAVYDRGVTTETALRPTAFGRRSTKQIDDPIIEPLWRGERVLVEIDRGQLTLRDNEGAETTTEEALLAELAAALTTESAILDGYLTYQATQPTRTLLVGSEVPTAGQMASQILVGRGLKSRAMRPIEQAEAKLAKPPDHPLAFVAVDLLEFDGLSLLDIPLLERKRLLESVLTEGELVRRSAFVRPPVDPWLASWRSMGFLELAYKAANGRYVRGERNDDWALARIPTA